MSDPAGRIADANAASPAQPAVFTTKDRDDLPSTPSVLYTAAAPDMQLIRDLLAGTRQMHRQYRVYIEKWAAEKPQNYKRRATMAESYGGLARSLSASVGMLFAREPLRSDTWTPEIAADWENLDGKGTHGNVFAKRHADDALADGLVGVLVDFPPVPEGVTVTTANEAALNLRPKWAAYRRSDILSWQTAPVDNVETLTQVVLREGTATRSGRFGVKPKLQYRVCHLAVTPPARPGSPPTRAAWWELLEETKNRDGSVTVTEVGRGEFLDRDGVPFPEIPLAVGYAGRTDAILCADPPLLDLAYCNLAHWRIANDLRYYESLLCFPMPVISGTLVDRENPDGTKAPGQFTLGPNVFTQLTAESKFEFAELRGTSLAALRSSLDAKRDEMGELGASFLRKIQRGIETAEAKRLDATAENATLATSSRGYEDMLNQALMFHARYRGIPKEQAPTLTLNRDFETEVMDATVMTAYATLHEKMGLPVGTILKQLKTGSRLSEDEDLDALEAEMASNEIAQAKQAQLDAAAQLDAVRHAAGNGPAKQAA